MSCSPLGAQIGAFLICALAAWRLIFRIFDLIDSRRRNWPQIIALAVPATILYLLPGYLLAGWPW